MEMWIPKEKCMGCGACFNVCPRGAITMQKDENGFQYPVIDRSKCINCGLCKRTCPILEKKIPKQLDSLELYAGWSKDADLRYTSTSGGLFTEITKFIIQHGGFVVGARYNKDNMVEHAIASNLEELEELKQSKYLQSDTNSIYKRVKNLLDEQKIVAFCGAPCQVAGLYKFLQKVYDNLLTIEFICRGMNSPKAYRAWLDEIEMNSQKRVKKVWFKYKINGWKTSPKCTRVDFEDGTYHVYDGSENLYMRGYLESNLYIRPSCGNCQFNGLPRQADITLADFWGIKDELDDDKGTSLILINRENGKYYFNAIIDNIVYEKRDINEIYKGNVCFSKSVDINKNSEIFLKSLNQSNFSSQLKKYGKKSIIGKLRRKLKHIIKK